MQNCKAIHFIGYVVYRERLQEIENSSKEVFT